MDKDRTELVDLSAKFPARAKEMAAAWEQWFKSTSGNTFKARKRKGKQANKNKKNKDLG